MILLMHFNHVVYGWYIVTDMANDFFVCHMSWSLLFRPGTANSESYNPDLVWSFQIILLNWSDEVYSRLEYAHWDLHTGTCTLRSPAHEPPLAPNAWNIMKHYLKRHNQCISECQHSIGKWQCYDDSLFEHIHIMIYDNCQKIKLI